MKYLIIGSKGQLGKEFVQKFNELGEKYICADRDELDITSLDAVNNFFDKYKPRIVINCSAYNLVDKAETDSFDAFNVNSIGVYNLAIASKNINAYLVHYSSDYVFD
ncbi:MAG: sugar nucleotide-binding protein, partial [Nanoarchaeota archaeon]|nr:sugar nucleotide-binding protein [Nanoarchaeota archaeon]